MCKEGEGKGTTPEVSIENQKFVPLLKSMPSRILVLFWKLLGWKGVMISLTVYLIRSGNIPQEAVPYLWAFIFLLILFGREGLKWIEMIKK